MYHNKSTINSSDVNVAVNSSDVNVTLSNILNNNGSLTNIKKWKKKLWKKKSAAVNVSISHISNNNVSIKKRKRKPRKKKSSDINVPTSHISNNNVSIKKRKRKSWKKKSSDINVTTSPISNNNVSIKKWKINSSDVNVTTSSDVNLSTFHISNLSIKKRKINSSDVNGTTYSDVSLSTFHIPNINLSIKKRKINSSDVNVSISHSFNKNISLKKLKKVSSPNYSILETCKNVSAKQDGTGFLNENYNKSNSSREPGCSRGPVYSRKSGCYKKTGHRRTPGYGSTEPGYSSTEPGHDTMQPGSHSTELLQEMSEFIDFFSPCSSILGYCVTGKTKKKILVSLGSTNQLVLNGCYCIKPVIGSVRVLGYTVRQNEKIPIFSESHRALIVVTVKYTEEFVGDNLKSNISDDYSSYNASNVGGKTSIEDKRNKTGDVLLDQKMLESTKKIYRLSDTDVASLCLQVGSPVVLVELSNFASNLSAVLQQAAAGGLVTTPSSVGSQWRQGLQTATPVMGGKAQHPVVSIPHSWHQAAQELFKVLGANRTTADGSPTGRGIRVVIVGNKGSGKSTFLKYLINSLLDNRRNKLEDGNRNRSNFSKDISEKQSILTNNYNATSQPNDCNKTSASCNATDWVSCGNTSRDTLYPAVCCMDLDPGQPEQSLPGVMSVARYSKPVLGSAFTYSVSTHKTRQYMRDKAKMFQTRREAMKTLLRGVHCKSAKSGGFSDLEEMLEDANATEDEVHCGEVTRQLLLGNVEAGSLPMEYTDIVKELMKTVAIKHHREPLVVNTMGWTAGKGLHFLADIIRIVGATHVFHLADGSMTQLHCMNLEKFVDGRNESFGSGRNNPSTKFRNNKFDYNYFQIQSAVKQIPLRNVAVRHSPADLRNLMFTSYFTALWSPNTTIFNTDTTSTFEVAIESVALLVQNSFISTDKIVRVMLSSLVALCQTVDRNIVRSGPGLPSTFKAKSERCNYFRPEVMMNRSTVSTTLFEVHGWAIVIGATTGKLRLLSPIQEDTLVKVNLIVKTKINLPKFFNKLIF